MEGDFKQRPEPDLDKTDRLPILQGIQIAPDVADDAVPMDHAATLPVTSSAADDPAAPRRGVSGAGVNSAVDLPSLAQSVRSVEERFARQSAENDALTRAYERAREAEAALGKRVQALMGELAAARTALETEHGRSLELERLSTERGSAAESARVRAEEALREAERYQSEARTLRDSLAARDASIAQALHSLGERDAQLSALQREHARVVPALEANSKSTSQLEADLQAARADANALGAELKTSREQVAALSQELKRGESEINAARQDLSIATIQASSYLELLQTREWRRGFDESLFRELAAQAGDVKAGQGTLESERQRLQHEVAALQARLSAQSAHASADQAARIEQLQAEAQVREREAQAREREAQARKHEAQAREHEAQAKEREMAELKAQLEETQRPIQEIEAEVKRLTAELASKAVAFTQFEAENRILRATLERTRDTLQERELLIRRLERGETDNADVLEHIQTRMERLISVPPGAARRRRPRQSVRRSSSGSTSRTRPLMCWGGEPVSDGRPLANYRSIRVR